VEQKAPNYIDLAKTMLAALEKQEQNIELLRRKVTVQDEVNTAFDARLRNVEQELLSSKRQQEQSKPKEEKGVSSDKEDSLEEAFRHIFGPAVHASPEGLLWILGRNH